MGETSSKITDLGALESHQAPAMNDRQVEGTLNSGRRPMEQKTRRPGRQLIEG